MFTEYPPKRIDMEHPDMATLPYEHVPLPTETKRQIYREHRRGDSAAALARRFCRTGTTVYRIINEMRAARIMELPLDYIGIEQFARLRSEKKDREILGPPPESDLPAKKLRVPSGMPAYMASLYEVPLLTREQEVASLSEDELPQVQGEQAPRDARRAAAQAPPDGPDREAVRRIGRDQEPDHLGEPSAGGLDCQAVRRSGGGLLRAGQRRQHVVAPCGGEVRCFAGQPVQHLRNLGDHEEFRPHHPCRPPSSGPFLHQSRGGVQAPPRTPARTRTSRSRLKPSGSRRWSRILGRLDERERQIVTSRFGLTRGQEPLTLKQVGAAMGVTKERVRQIQERAMGKLRMVAEKDHIESVF